MEKKESESFVTRFYNKFTAPLTIIVCIYGVLVLYLSLLVIGVIIAATLGPEGYSITTHMISALGSIETTPVPILYDLACISAGTLTIPFIFYLEKHIAPIPRKVEDFPASHRWSFRFMGMGFFFSMLGSIFYIGVGIFSADREMLGQIEMHMICSYGAFGGFAFAAIFIGLAIVFVRQDIIPKPFNYPIGLWGAFGPIIITIFNLTEGEPLLEWLLLFAILIWIIPLSVFTLRHAAKQLHNEA